MRVKVIELINKIANNEIPQKIVWKEQIFHWNNIANRYERTDEYNETNWIVFDGSKYEILDSEVEIIEDKKIEKLGLITEDERTVRYPNCREIAEKLNEIIDEVNKIKENEDVR